MRVKTIDELAAEMDAPPDWLRRQFEGARAFITQRSLRRMEIDKMIVGQVQRDGVISPPTLERWEFVLNDDETMRLTISRPTVHIVEMCVEDLG